MAAKEPKSLIEVSSEAGRKIGGIYTVLRSKAPYFQSKFKQGYLLIGFLDEKCNEDVRWEEPKGALKDIFSELEASGVRCKAGKWIYGGEASIICVDAKAAAERHVEYINGTSVQKDRQINYFKFLLWKNFGVDSLTEKSWDFDENVGWCLGAGMLLQKLFEKGIFDERATVIQFHEWISGAALLHCKMNGLKAGTVFTTHATVLGRALASAGVDVLKESMESKEPISINVAYNMRVEGKHQLEMAAARESTIFTTVSKTVAEEVRYMLGRQADIITTNGIEIRSRKELEEEHDLSSYARRELQQFLEACFISYYPQRYDNPLFVYISGRYEFTNKGFDIFIEALGKLNERLKKRKADRKIFAFIFAPSSVKGPKISIIKNYLLLDKITEILEEIPSMRNVKYANLQETVQHLNGSIRHDIENMLKGFVKDGEKPHINCYDLAYQNDSIIKACVEAGLDNRKENAVKVIFYPTYIKPNDGLMNLNYYDVISAMDVGVFPSRYEPFGYTPVEAAIKGSIAITSDMTGFGRYMMEKRIKRDSGIIVIRMAGKSKSAASDELSQELERIYHLPQNSLERQKNRAMATIRHIDWAKLVKNYYAAYSKALQKAKEGW
ncbi:MAG: glycogen/starch synthase [Candidatus Micrarchaeota archaeon]|nr:glycogen/starch synthase [Candidatus Micrarchaeota archaeon]